LALKELSKRRQVVIPAYTCFSVPSAIIKAGLEIVPCDIDPDTFDYNYDSLVQVVNGDTLCVLSVHLFGIPADLNKTKRICSAKGAFVVEDAAQAMGGRWGGKLLGMIGDVGVFSLGRGKNITCGSAGIIVTNDSRIGRALASQYTKLDETSFAEDVKNLIQVALMSVFIRPWLYWLPSGIPFLRLGETFFYPDFSVRKLSCRRATLLHSWKERLIESNRVRIENAKRLGERFPRKGNPERDIPYLRFPILVDDRQTRDWLYSCSQHKGLGFSVMYPTPVNEIPELRFSLSGQVFPAAQKVADTLLTLPTHHLVSGKDTAKIINLLDLGPCPAAPGLASPA
jgi:perosamine synthetase